MTWLETSSVAPPSASRWNVFQRSRRSTGSSPTVGSSRTSSSGEPSSAVASDTRARWPPERRLTTWSRERLQPDRRERGVGRVAPRSEHAREVAQVLADGQVAVHGRRLRHVADAPRAAAASRPPGRARGPSQTRLLHADDRAQERRLAGAARAEQARHSAAAHLEREFGQHRASRRGRRGGGRPGSRTARPLRDCPRRTYVHRRMAHRAAGRPFA